MKLILFFFVVLSCGRTVVTEKSSFPDNNISPVESEVLTKALKRIQAEFDTQKIKVKLNSVPYHVNDLPGAMAGACYKMGSNVVGIAIDHEMFDDAEWDDGEYPLLFKVLLHEIGHCFFNRKHDEKYIKADEGFEFEVDYYGSGEPWRDQSLQVSIMSEMGWYRIPPKLWPYFLREVARKDRLQKWEDMKKYIPISRVPKPIPN